MGTEERAASVLGQYGLEDLPRYADPERRLYEAFGLGNAGLRQLFGLKVWKRGFQAGLLGGHGVGLAKESAAQMPGIFVIHNGHLLESFVHDSLSDRPDYGQLACESGVCTL